MTSGSSASHQRRALAFAFAALLGSTSVLAAPPVSQDIPATTPEPRGLPPAPKILPQYLPPQPEDNAVFVDDRALARRAAKANDPAEALARYLRVLSRDPMDLESLIGAGDAALDIGDANAALNFFARAEQIDSRNGRVKAGLGSAMVQLVQPKPALKLFNDALDDGVPLAEIAADRGLAYDLRGDSKRARADYELAMRTNPTPELTRRLALSMAMAGDVPGALATIDGLLRRQDKAAWRDRAFIQAIGGDVAAANRTAGSILPASQADALKPFLERIAKLKPGQQAAAVHFGQFPYDGHQYSEAELFAGAGIDAPVATPSTTLHRGGARNPKALADDEGDGVGLDAPLKAKPMKAATGKDKTALVQSDFSLPAKSAEDRAAEKLAAEKLASEKRAAEKQARDEKLAAEKIAREAAAKDKLAKELAAKEQAAKDKALKDKAAKDQAAKDAKDKTAKDKADKTKATAASKSKEPERYWVQVATGAYKPDLTKAWGNLKTKYPALLGRYTPWTTPLNRTNRLMIGPFKSAQEAQAFVNRSGGAGFGTSPVTTPAGQAVERVGN